LVSAEAGIPKAEEAGEAVKAADDDCADVEAGSVETRATRSAAASPAASETKGAPPGALLAAEVAVVAVVATGTGDTDSASELNGVLEEAVEGAAGGPKANELPPPKDVGTPLPPNARPLPNDVAVNADVDEAVLPNTKLGVVDDDDEVDATNALPNMDVELAVELEVDEVAEDAAAV
jgi:hypothetical protein